MNPYVVAGYTIYWRFPTTVERLAYVAKAVEVDRIAHQLSDDTFWVLIGTSPAVWSSIGGSSDSKALIVPAGAALGGQRAVVVEGGKAYYASIEVPNSANGVVGISMGAAALDAPISIQLLGEMVDPSWNWLPNLPIFLGVDGALTQVLPVTGFQLIVGKPTKPTGLIIDIKFPILL